MAISLVWYKRDLRLQDHPPLADAIASGRPLLMIYCFEPMLMSDPRYSARHWRFVGESLHDINAQLAPQGARVHVFLADTLELLQCLHDEFTIDTIYSHEETGVELTFERDRQVADFASRHGIAWRESPSNGVQRGRRDRKGWNRQWRSIMQAPQAEVSLRQLQPAVLDPQGAAAQLLLRRRDAEWAERDDRCQSGGPTAAARCLDSFFAELRDNRLVQAEAQRILGRHVERGP